MRFKLCLSLLAAVMLSGCGALGQPTPQPLPTVVLESQTVNPQATSLPRTGGVTASGKVVPAQQAQLAFALGGNVKNMAVVEGDSVQAGQVLASLAGSEKLTAAIAAANLELLSAQQAVSDLNQNADLARAQAQQRLADAQKTLKDAQDDRYRKNLARVTQATLDQTQADLIIAKDKLKDEQENYDKYANRAENDVQRAQAFSQLAAAQQKVEQIQWNLNYLISRPDVNEVQQADAAIGVAQANLAAAQHDVAQLKDGPDPDALTLAKARVENAKAQLSASQSALGDLELKSPFAGIVSAVSVHSGEWVVPGQPVLALTDLAHLRVETTDLSETDVPQVKLGQAVSVYVKALSMSIPGKVSQISSLADILGGDVVYKTTITLDTLPPALRAGMSVEVQFN